jgi:hypothetical protein
MKMKSDRNDDKPGFDLKDLRRRVICEAAATAMLAKLKLRKQKS